MERWAKNKMRINEEIGRKSESMIYSTLFKKRRAEFSRVKKIKPSKYEIKSFRTTAVLKDKKKVAKKNYVPLMSAALKIEKEHEKSFESSDLSSTDEEEIKKHLPSDNK